MSTLSTQLSPEQREDLAQRYARDTGLDIATARQHVARAEAAAEAPPPQQPARLDRLGMEAVLTVAMKYGLSYAEALRVSKLGTPSPSDMLDPRNGQPARYDQLSNYKPLSDIDKPDPAAVSQQRGAEIMANPRPMVRALTKAQFEQALARQSELRGRGQDVSWAKLLEEMFG